MKKSGDYYKNDDGSYYINDEGLRVPKPKTPTNKGGAAAERSRSEGRGRMAAKRKALKAVMNKIPASPTR